jgi:hypothetical protein
MAAGHRVAIVVGPGFAAEVRRIAAGRHVWAIRTHEYQRVADEDRRRSPGHTPERGVTLFSAGEASPEHEVISIFGTVEEHHGEYSHRPPLDEVEVLGADPTAEVRAELSAFGFTDIVPSGRGFLASRKH